MAIGINPEVDSGALLQLMEESLKESLQGPVEMKSQWDAVYQVRRTSFQWGEAFYQVDLWFRYYQDSIYIKYEVEVSSPHFHLRSSVIESPWERDSLQEAARKMGLVLGKMGNSLLSTSA